MCSNDSGWFLHKGQFQLLYKSGLRFLMCSTVGSSSIKNLIFEIFLLEAANDVSVDFSRLLRISKVSFQSIKVWRYFLFLCKFNQVSNPQLYEIFVMKCRKCCSMIMLFHLGIYFNDCKKSVVNEKDGRN
jgi:hypothetical protein